MLYLQNIPYFGDLAPELGAIDAALTPGAPQLVVGAFRLPHTGTRSEYTVVVAAIDDELATLAETVGPSGIIVLVFHSEAQRCGLHRIKAVFFDRSLAVLLNQM